MDLSILILSLCGIALCSAAIDDRVSVTLSALKPDLEFLRSHWLQNPAERQSEGRIVFLKNCTISVQFAPRKLRDDWDQGLASESFQKDYLVIKNIADITDNEGVNIAVLVYKHSEFFGFSQPDSSPRLLPDNSTYEVDSSVDPESDKSCIEIRYIDLNVLAEDIDREAQNIGSLSKGALNCTRAVLKYEGARFAFWIRPTNEIEVPDVRVVEFDEGLASLDRSMGYSVIKFDKKGKVFRWSDDELDSRRLVVRSTSDDRPGLIRFPNKF